MLTNEGPKYLFEGQNCQMSDRFSELNVGDPRPRSDSSGSNMSNSSSTSASSRPPYTSSHSYMNVPGYRGPIIGTEDGHPSTAPVLPNDINNFMEFCRYEPQSTAEIPNINCNNSQSVQQYAARTLQQQSGSYGHNSSGMVSNSSSQPNLRQIEVQHIQTNRGDCNLPQSFSEFSIQPNHGTVGGLSHSSQSQPVTPNRGWVQHPVRFNNPYHNLTYTGDQNSTFQADHRNLTLPHQQQPSYNMNQSTTPTYRSPVEEQRSLMGYGQYGSQHLSQATIFLQNPTASPNSKMNSAVRVEQPILSPGEPYSSNLGDINCTQNMLRSPSVNNSQVSPQGLGGKSVVLEIKAPQRGTTGVQSHIQYFNQIANTGRTNSIQGSASPQTVQTTVLGHVSPQNEQTGSESQPPFVNRLYHPERPTVINFHGIDEGFLKFPPMSDECRVPSHQHGGPLQKCGSVDSSGSVFGPDIEYRPLHQSFMSPSSSPSSLSSESSAVRDRPRSGSLQEDPAYTQALLSHQKSRMDKLTEDLGVAEKRLEQLKGEVMTLESRVIERKRKKSSVFPSSVDLAKLRSENLQLKADIQLMTREIDLFNNGQTPLGVLDPLEQQNFYKNMNTGQRGSIYASASQVTPRTFESTLTTVTTSVSTPTRPPPEIPPQLPPRDPTPRDVPPPLPPRISASHVLPPPSHQPTVNSGDSDADGEQWSCSACTFLNHPALNKCECCEMPRMNTTSPLNSPRGSVSHTHVHSDLCYCHDH
ncbi:TGF-beta-activated kinase 1 and MAP3K7-binding protein 2 [Mactra antiquata]